MDNKAGSDFEAVAIRLGQLIKSSKDADIHRFLGMSQSSYSNRKKRGTIPYDEIVSACIRDGLSLDYVLAGRDRDCKKPEPISPELAIGLIMGKGGNLERNAGKALLGILMQLGKEQGDLTPQRIVDAVGVANQILLEFTCSES